MKTAVIRTDATPFIGIGHVMRCLTLAQRLKKQDWAVIFVCRKFENHFCDVIKQQGFELRFLETPDDNFDAPAVPPHAAWLGVNLAQDCFETQDTIADLKTIDLLVIDHYAIDRRWEEQFLDRVGSILVIDDLADRPHHCDMLIDQTFGREKHDYHDLVPPECNLMCGTDFTLLRDEFLAKRSDALKKRETFEGPVKNILISMGSGDPQNSTGKILDALSDLDDPLNIKILLSSKAPHLDKLEFYQFNYPHQVKVLTDHEAVADEMMWADLAFGAGGTMSWERCSLGLPTLVVIIADNQDMIAKNLQAQGAIDLLGRMSDLKPERIKDKFLALSTDIERLRGIAATASGICDGQGIERVTEAIDIQEQIHSTGRRASSI